MLIQEPVTSFRFNVKDVEKFKKLAKSQGIYQKDMFRIMVNSIEDSINNNTLLEDTKIKENTQLYK